MCLEEAQGWAGEAESQAQLLHLLTQQWNGVGGPSLSPSGENGSSQGGVSTPSLSTILALSPIVG